jgi:hypothetical protein
MEPEVRAQADAIRWDLIHRRSTRVAPETVPRDGVAAWAQAVAAGDLPPGTTGNGLVQATQSGRPCATVSVSSRVYFDAVRRNNRS